MAPDPRQLTAPPAAQASAARFRDALRRATLRRARRPDLGLFDQWSWLFPRVVLTALLSLASLGFSRQDPPAPDPPLVLSPPCIPPSRASEPIVVIVTRSQILVGDDPTPVVLLPSREQLVASGVDAKYKRSGPSDMRLVPLEQALTRARETSEGHCRPENGDRTTEAVVVADGGTPYRLLMEVLFTLGQSGLGKYHLMVTTKKK